MSDLINLLDNAETFEAGRTQTAYSRVIMNVTDTLYYTAGNDTGETLEVDCPFGTQAICNAVLASVKGYAYAPYEASGALLDPAAELGDSVYVKDTMSTIGTMDTQFGQLMKADISAPGEEDVDTEYAYESKADRKITRTLANVQSEINQQADQISAKVSQTGGSSQSFSWSLTSSGFILANSGSEVFRADKDGITVTGEVHATSGYIGTDASGFVIDSDAIYKGLKSYSASGTGVYIGTDGINLGGKFKVDSSGNISASSATFTGSVYASNIKYGSTGGYMSGSGLSGGSVSTGKLGSGINTSLGYADDAHSFMLGTLTASFLRSVEAQITSLTIKNAGVTSSLTAVSGTFTSAKATNFTFNGYACAWKQAVDSGGNTIYVIGRK